jgi:hypothetical protein
VVAAEKGVQSHDRALARLAAGLEDWLSGRGELAAFGKTLRQVKADLGKSAGLPRGTAAQVEAAERSLLASVSSFAAQRAPDAEGQRAMFQSLNNATRERALALLDWRAGNNAGLRKSARERSAREYLVWEAAWLPLWKSETEIGYRLQKAFLQKTPVEGAGSALIRELLALQARASEVPAGKSVQGLQELAVRRLTLLARTAEQLDRLGRGATHGAITRVRRLNKEQTELVRQLQEQRLAILTALARP